jgi:hypothetical protein
MYTANAAGTDETHADGHHDALRHCFRKQSAAFMKPPFLALPPHRNRLQSFTLVLSRQRVDVRLRNGPD